MKFAIYIIFLALLSPRVMAEDKSPVFVADSGSKQVDDLVAQLVSRNPAPYPSSGVAIPDDFNGMSGEVSEAIKKLRNMGSKIYPFLLKHLDDDRYSYSEKWVFGSGPEGIMNVTVSEAIKRDVFFVNLEIYLYRGRKDSNGKNTNQPQDLSYVESKGGLKKWVAIVKDQSESKIVSDFFDWCIAYEKKQGFLNEKQEKDVLLKYENLKKRRLEKIAKQATNE